VLILDLTDSLHLFELLMTRDREFTQLTLQGIALLGVPGLSALIEFVTRGGGTPYPYDPPERLVTTGVYAYIANPMQLSMSLLLAAWGAWLLSPWVAAAGAMAVVYSLGLANSDETQDLSQRFGPAWREYRHHVRAWFPRTRPYRAADNPDAVLLLDLTGCATCRSFGEWFQARNLVGLAIQDAAHHHSLIWQVTYLDGEYQVSGFRALARGLEHIHLGWAALGWTLRLPGIAHLGELLVRGLGPIPHAVGGEKADNT
jgi:hypothetical protein